MKKRILHLVFSLAIILNFISITSYADVGPKPSIVIDFEGLEGESYFVTLLSADPSTGPYEVYDESSDSPRFNENDEDFEIWQKLIAYEDEDAFYFLQYFENCSETSRFTWGYYPPTEFKILIYFPEEDNFAVSGESYERYAFDSYYKVDAENLMIQSVESKGEINAEKNYDFTWETVSLFSRIIATIAIELLIALFFGFRAKRQLYLIAVVNLITQSILNILLNVINYHQGGMMFVINYIWMELLVFAIEALAYCRFMPTYAEGAAIKQWRLVLYALIANALSFGLGLYLAYLIPGIF